MVPRGDRMVPLNTTVPKPMKDWLRARAAARSEASIGFVLREIVREKMEREARGGEE